MGQIIKTFSDGSFIEYDRGKFDEWCVYYTNSNGKRNPPKDTEYFEQLKNLAETYGADRIYNDFVEVYIWTKKSVEEDTLTKITELADTYGDDSLVIDVIFSILYVAMIAEENKAFTKLGKRIKRLGIHVLLLEDKSVFYAANYMKGKNWREISTDCQQRGF